MFAMPENKVEAKGNPSNNVRANVVINLIRTLTLTILSFITFPYVTRALGDQVFGLYTWANTFVYYFLVLAKISIPNIAVRECMKVRGDKEKFSHMVQLFFIAQAVTSLFSYALLAVLAFSVPVLQENNGLIFLLSINFLAGAFSFEWVYMTLEKHFYITVRSIMTIFLSAMMVFLFIKKTVTGMNEIYIYAAITISSTVLTSLVNVTLLPKYVSFRKTGPYDFKPLIRPLLTLALISVALTLYNQTDEFILGFIDESKASVGAYSVGVKGVDIIIGLIISLYAVFMPRAAYYHEKGNKYFYQNLINYSMNITFFIAIPAIATMIPLASQITALISGSEVSGQYADANYILMILASMMITYSIGDNIYTEILIPEKKEKIYLYSMLAGVVLNVGFSFLFAYVILPSHPAMGVAIATSIADLLVLVTLIQAGWKYAHPAIFNTNNLKIVVVGIAIFLATFFLAPVLQNALPWNGDNQWKSYIVTMLVLVGGDALLYIGLLLIMKERLVSSFLPSHRKKAKEEGGVHE